MSGTGEFLGMVKTQIIRSEFAYKAYKDSGRTFLYARILKDVNDSLKCLLLSKTHLLPPEHINNSLILIHHIDVWSAVWEDAYASQKPSLTSVFVFENTVNFPRKEVSSLLNYYEKNFGSGDLRSLQL
jgi:hypothetical protein